MSTITLYRCYLVVTVVQFTATHHYNHSIYTQCTIGCCIALRLISTPCSGVPLVSCEQCVYKLLFLLYCCISVGDLHMFASLLCNGTPDMVQCFTLQLVTRLGGYNVQNLRPKNFFEGSGDESTVLVMEGSLPLAVITLMQNFGISSQ